MKRKFPDLDLTPVPHLDLPDCYLIPLANGGHTIIEEEDLCRVDEHLWSRVDSRQTSYAVRHVLVNGRKTLISMHRHLLGLGPEDRRIKVDHKNHNGLDNRRSVNLRLASDQQNVTNKRPEFTHGTNKYRGVSWRKNENRFGVNTQLTINGVVRKIKLGNYQIEEEGAYAYQVAASLIRDPEFLDLMPIPLEKMPSAERRDEIQKFVTEKIKLSLAGKKGIIGAASQFRCVSFHAGLSRWRSLVRHESKRILLGWFKTEHEAAFAYNVFLSHVNAHDLTPNEIEAASLPDAGELESIKASVIARVDHALGGGKGRAKTTSAYNGVIYRKQTAAWRAAINIKRDATRRTTVFLGNFTSEVEAAIAFNCGAEELSHRAQTLNTLDDDELPSPERVTEIEAAVRKRVASFKEGRRGTGKKLETAVSRFHGVSYYQKRDHWITQMVCNGSKVVVGTFKTEPEAALAFNVAIGLIGLTHYRPNSISEADLSSPSVAAVVKAKVEARMARLMAAGTEA